MTNCLRLLMILHPYLKVIKETLMTCPRDLSMSDRTRSLWVHKSSIGAHGMKPGVVKKEHGSIL